MRIPLVISLLLISIVALWAHAERLPTPPGPAYSGFMPGDWQYRAASDSTGGCD
jgi:hypothetical protein